MSNIDKLKPGKYAILFRNNWDGEGDNYETFAILDAEGIWRDEDGGELLEYQGDEVLSAWPMDDGSNVLALLVELEAAERRMAELEARMVKLPERYEVDMYPTPSPNGEWFSREDVLAALVSADVSYAAVNGKGE